MFEKILVPLDGSEQANSILPYVAYLVKGMGSRLHILSVIKPDEIGVSGDPRTARSEGVGPVAVKSGGSVGVESQAHVRREALARFPTRDYDTGGPYVSQAFDREESRLRHDLSGIVDELAEDGLTARVAVRIGDAAEQIVSYANTHECDLIAMSTHGRNMVSRALLGSVTDSVIRTSDVPTLTISPEKAKQYWTDDDVSISKILVPLDGSELAESAIPFAAALARKLSMEIVLVGAVKVANLPGPDAVGHFYATDARLPATVEAETHGYLSGVVDYLRKAGLAANYVLKVGAPAAIINEFAHDTPNNMIALTTHGRSGLRRMALGSVTSTVVRNAGDPVLVIPPVRPE
jgi:nucleotide-binding universal stress UspA family protein